MMTTKPRPAVAVPFLVVAFIVAAVLLSACKTVPLEEDVPLDLSAAELIQMAQTAYDDGNPRASEVYYRLIVKRFGDDLPTRVGAEFELAHIKVKEEKWAEARPLLKAIITYYEGPDAYALPPAYQKLAEIDLKKVPL